MERKSRICTLIAQLSLCFGLFVALNMGRPQIKRSVRTPLDIYFVSVRGGFRPLQEQTHLLKQVEKVVQTCKAKFVIDVSELGEKDPLMQNATLYFQSLKVPWYTTKVTKRKGADYFRKQIDIPYEKTLDLIALDTGSLQDPSSGTRSDQLDWLARILEASNSNWQIVVGFHPMVACDKKIDDSKLVAVSLYNVLQKHGVDVYLSSQGCHNLEHGDMAEISNAGSIDKGPYLTTINQRVVSHKESVNGFLLHRVSSLEIVTYFVSLTGEVVHEIAIQQRGKEVM